MESFKRKDQKIESQAIELKTIRKAYSRHKETEGRLGDQLDAYRKYCQSDYSEVLKNQHYYRDIQALCQQLAGLYNIPTSNENVTILLRLKDVIVEQNDYLHSLESNINTIHDSSAIRPIKIPNQNVYNPPNPTRAAPLAIASKESQTSCLDYSPLLLFIKRDLDGLDILLKTIHASEMDMKQAFSSLYGYIQLIVNTLSSSATYSDQDQAINTLAKHPIASVAFRYTQLYRKFRSLTIINEALKRNEMSFVSVLKVLLVYQRSKIILLMSLIMG